MARAVRHLGPALAALLLLPIAGHALGPAQPFTAPAATAHAADAATTAAPATSSGLAGVRLGTSPGALVDGQWIALGQAVRGARLVSVRAHDVSLRHTDGRIERLALFPEVQPPTTSANSGTDAVTHPDPLVAKRDPP